MPTIGKVEIGTYGQYASENYGANAIVVRVGPVTLWFSYQTLVAFESPLGRFVHTNVWGTTTGKHLNWIDGGEKKERVSSEIFADQLSHMQKVYNLI